MEKKSHTNRRDVLKAASIGIALQSGLVGVSAGQDRGNDHSVFDSAKQDLRITNNEGESGVVKIKFNRRKENSGWKLEKEITVPVNPVSSPGMIKRMDIDLESGLYKATGKTILDESNDNINLPELVFRVPEGGIPDYWSLSINVKKKRAMMTYYEI